VVKIVAMLHDGASDADLGQHLDWAETVQMGLRRDQERLKVVAATLRAINPLA
jgi:hypothetical protein